MISNRPENRFKWTRKSTSRNLQTYRNEPVQPYILREFVRSIRPTSFIDIGANIGYYSLLIAEEETVKNVFAYEPMPSTYNELRKNVKKNNLDDVINCSTLALSDEEGTSNMDVISELSGRNSLSSTAIHRTATVKRNVHVKTSTVDNLFDISANRIALKIDVEGHELQVLHGAINLLKNNTTIIQIEILDAHNDREATQLLDTLGYRKLFTAGPDHYFTNDQIMMNLCLSILETAFKHFIEDFKQPIYLKYWLFPWMGIEISPTLMRFMPKSMRQIISLMRNH